MLEHDLRPWEVSRLTWPQAKIYLGLDVPAAAAVGRSSPSASADTPQPISHREAQELFRRKQAEIFAKMAAAGGVADLRALAELPIERLEQIYLDVSGNLTVDRLQMRVALLSHLPPQQ
jgi:hypothetical protein